MSLAPALVTVPEEVEFAAITVSLYNRKLTANLCGNGGRSGQVRIRTGRDRTVCDRRDLSDADALEGSSRTRLLSASQKTLRGICRRGNS